MEFRKGTFLCFFFPPFFTSRLSERIRAGPPSPFKNVSCNIIHIERLLIGERSHQMQVRHLLKRNAGYLECEKTYSGILGI